MAEIEASLLAKVQNGEGTYGRSALVGFLRSRKKYLGTLIEAADGQSLNELKREIKRKGGKKLKIYQEINTIYAEMPVDHITDLTSISCVQHVYDAEGDVQRCLQESVPLVMGVDKFHLPYRFKGRRIQGQGVKVAIIDDGIDKRHPDFAWKIKRVKKFNGGRKYRGMSHGTHVAGIIAGSGKQSGYRYVGVAPKAKLYVAKVFKNSEENAPRNSILEAIRWAIRIKVDVINMSLGGRACSDGTCPMCKMVDYAVRQGITVVVSAGNNGPFEGTIGCPGNAKLAITVGASTKTQPILVLPRSSRGSLRNPDKPDMVAPGQNIMAPQPDKQYAALSGTSMAAPHVAGLAALLYQVERSVKRKRTVTPAEIKSVLKEGCKKLRESPIAQGSGLVNFTNSLPTIDPPRTLSRLSGKNKRVSQSADVEPAVERAEIDRPACPAKMNLFCPHYDERDCAHDYESCIYYRLTQQSKILQVVTNDKHAEYAVKR